VNCGVVGGIGWISIGVPQGLTGATGAMGAAGTNTVTNIFTAFNFTNQVLGNRRTVLFSTNNFTFGTSNFLARVPNLYNELMEPGMLGAAGLTPGTNVFEQLWEALRGRTAGLSSPTVFGPPMRFQFLRSARVVE